MSLSRRFTQSLQISFPLQALVLAFLLLASREGAASTANSSWSQQPAWSQPDQTDPPHPSRKSLLTEDTNRYKLAPFAPGSSNLALDMGQVFLMGGLGQYSNNIGGQLHYTYGVSELFGFDASAGYSSHSEGFSMASLLGGLRTNLSWYDKVVPYVVFGMGFYKPSFQVGSSPGAFGTTDTVSPVLFGIHAGPGVDLELTKYLFFGAALTFHDVFGNNELVPDGNGGTMGTGGTFTTFYLHAGVTF